MFKCTEPWRRICLQLSLIIDTPVSLEDSKDIMGQYGLMERVGLEFLSTLIVPIDKEDTRMVRLRQAP